MRLVWWQAGDVWSVKIEGPADLDVRSVKVEPAVIDEGWYRVEGDVVMLTNRDGVPLPGEDNRCTLKPGETAREAAVRLLRAKSRGPASATVQPAAALSGTAVLMAHKKAPRRSAGPVAQEGALCNGT